MKMVRVIMTRVIDDTMGFLLFFPSLVEEDLL